MSKPKKKKGPVKTLLRAILSHPTVMRLAALLSSFLFKAYLHTLAYGFDLPNPVAPNWMKSRAIYVFWHETLLFPAYTEYPGAA